MESLTGLAGGCLDESYMDFPADKFQTGYVT